MKQFLKRHANIKKALMLLGVVFLVFALVNIVLLVMYSDRTYPGTKVQNQTVASTNKTQLQNQLANSSLLPQTLTLKHQNQTVELKPSELGLKVDTSKTAVRAVSQKSWLPVANFISPPKVAAQIAVDQKTFDDKTKQLGETFKKDPVDAKVTLKDGAFTITSQADGYILNESQLNTAIQTALAANTSKVNVPVTIVPPKVTSADLASNLQELKDHQAVTITYHFKDKTHKLSSTEIADMHELQGQKYVLADSKIHDVLINVGQEFGIAIKNIDEVVSATKAALQNKTTLDQLLVEAPKKTFTYCAALRGVPDGELGGLQSKLRAVYGLPRGWSLDGQISFQRVDSGCNFTVWLTAADRMSTFGAICDPQWSCAVGSNVVINYDRWKNASIPWNQSGGSLEDYRAMAINHETGHWLGFGHLHCGGVGQPAAVMMQQSVDLEGCKFNVWPLTNERETLKQRLGL